MSFQGSKRRGSKRQRIHFSAVDSSYGDGSSDDGGFSGCRAMDSSEDEDGDHSSGDDVPDYAAPEGWSGALNGKPGGPRTDSKEDSPEEWDAGAVLARSWRAVQARDPKEAKSLLSDVDTKLGETSESQHPFAQIQRIANTEVGQWVLKEQIKRAEAAMKVDLSNASRAVYEAMCASALQLLGKYEEAHSHWKRAVAGDPRRLQSAWHIRCEQARLQADAITVRASSQSKPASNLFGTMTVQRVAAGSLSREAFIERYANKGKPVIITGLLAGCTKDGNLWDMDFVRSKVGHKTVALKRIVRGSPKWAQLEDACSTTFSNFINGIEAKDRALCQSYCHDWSIPLHCPELLHGLRVPKYFAGDYLQHAPEGSLYRDTWPSLFIGAKGTYSELHVDTFHSNFWMGLMQGRKKWTFFKAEDAPYLQPQYLSPNLDPTFKLSPRDELQYQEILSRCRPTEVVLEQGEVLFVPAGCPHFVENLTDTVAISANFIDSSNLAGAVDHLRVQGYTNPNARALANILSDDSFVSTADEAIARVLGPLDDAKSQVASASSSTKPELSITYKAFKNPPNPAKSKRKAKKRVRFEGDVPPGHPSLASQSAPSSSPASNDMPIPPGGQTLEAFLQGLAASKSSVGAKSKIKNPETKVIHRDPMAGGAGGNVEGMDEEEGVSGESKKRGRENTSGENEDRDVDEDEDDDAEENTAVIMMLGSKEIRLGKRRKKRKLKAHGTSNGQTLGFRGSLGLGGRGSILASLSQRAVSSYYSRSPYYANDDDENQEGVIGMGYPKSLRALGYPKRHSEGR